MLSLVGVQWLKPGKVKDMLENRNFKRSGKRYCDWHLIPVYLMWHIRNCQNFNRLQMLGVSTTF